ncbi:MAG: HAD family hydrolase [Lachnospiraceae bacterium]
MIRLVASDLDGTLLKGDAQSLQPEIFEQIRQLKEQGILFVAASGRQLFNLYNLFGPVQDEIAYIAENGCLLQYQGKVLHKEQFARSVSDAILDELVQHTELEIGCSGEQLYYMDTKNEEFLLWLKNKVKNNVLKVESLRQVQEPMLKISIFKESGIEAESEFWINKFGGQAAVVTSGYSWLDFMPLGANKGKSLQKLQQMFDIAPAECMAFGDHNNDIEMLSSVQYNYAMEEAQPAVQKLCEFHTDSVERILAEVIAGTIK